MKIRGYICRSVGTNIATGRKRPRKRNGWFWYIPGKFATRTMRSLGIAIEPGTVKKVDIQVVECGG